MSAGSTHLRRQNHFRDQPAYDCRDKADRMPSAQSRTGGRPAATAGRGLFGIRLPTGGRHPALIGAILGDEGGDAARRRGQHARQLGRVEGEARGIDVDEQRPRARQLDRRDGRHRGMRDGDDIILGPDADRLQRQHQRIGAAADADAVADADVIGKLALERLDLLAQDVAAAFQHAGDRRVDLGALREISCPGVRLRDHRYSARCARK